MNRKPHILRNFPRKISLNITEHVPKRKLRQTLRGIDLCTDTKKKKSKLGWCSYSSSLSSLTNVFWQLLCIWTVKLSGALAFWLYTVRSRSVSTTAGVTKWKQLPQRVQSQTMRTHGGGFRLRQSGHEGIAVLTRGEADQK